MASETQFRERAADEREAAAQRDASPQPQISVVIPVYNEEENLLELYEELNAVLEPYGKSYELLFVDDGSSDASFAILKGIHQRDPRVRAVRFRKNFGQTAALAAGFDSARGDVIVTLDADLQNDPRDIPLLLERLSNGFDIVCGWRKDRKDPYWSRRVPSQVANRIISRTTGVHLHDYGCTLKAFRCDVVKNLHLYGDMHRFIPAVASGFGVLIDEVVVSHRPRNRGVSKYGLSRTFRVVLDLITIKFLLSFASRPLQIFGPPGLFLGAIGVGIGAYLSWLKLWEGQAIGGRPLLMFAVLLMLGGLQLVSLGLLAELQARQHHEERRRAPYTVRERLD